MIRTIRRTAAALLALLMLGMTPAYALDNNAQIKDEGDTAGTLAQDGVEVSKTIAPTGIENYFDITLTAKTQTVYTKKAAEDAHVVIVLDLSNTMRYKFDSEKIAQEGEVSRYTAAMSAVKAFIDDFVALTPEGSTADRKIGVAAFNTSGYKISDLTRCITTEEGNTLYNTVSCVTQGKFTSDYATSHERFTNMEAGLKVAKEMLQSSGNVANKMIVFITDGFPTTYLKNTAAVNNYIGWDPVCSSGTPGVDGVFSDAHASNKMKETIYCKDGTSYSNKAAIRAREMAETIRGMGIKIYSVGVDLDGQSIANYEKQSYGENDNGGLMHNKDPLSVIDTDRTDKKYDITVGQLDKWLEGTDANGGIGSGAGYYQAADSADGFSTALKNLVGDTNVPVGVGTTAQNTIDPVYSGSTGDFVEFVGFFGKDGNLKTSLAGKSAKWDEEGAENTAAFVMDTARASGENNKINWDLTKSAYDETVVYNEGGSAEKWTTKTVTRTYTLKYLVRLKNEAGGFTALTSYATNGTTTLNYTKTNGDGTTESKTIDYPIPQVEGYLGQLSFKKVDTDTGSGLSGAVFTLSHHMDCAQCKNAKESAPEEYKGVTIADMTATSAADGTVTFGSIPSGHSYVLSETIAPGMHHKLGETYTVSVEYGTVTISKKDTDTHITISPENGTVITNDSVMPGDVTIPFKKLLDGNAAPNGLFEFALVDKEGNELQRVSAVNGEGQFVVNYKGVMDTQYTYTIHEVNKGGRYNYDSTVYTVVVTLNAGTDGNYTASVAYYKGELAGSDDQLTEPVPIEGVPVFNNSTRSSSSSTHTTPVPIIVNKPPKSGGMSGLGLVIGLMAAAAVVSRKRRK